MKQLRVCLAMTALLGITACAVFAAGHRGDAMPAKGIGVLNVKQEAVTPSDTVSVEGIFRSESASRQGRHYGQGYYLQARHGNPMHVIMPSAATAAGIGLRLGDGVRVTIIGTKVMRGGDTSLVANQIICGNKTYVLRDTAQRSDRYTRHTTADQYTDRCTMSSCDNQAHRAASSCSQPQQEWKHDQRSHRFRGNSARHHR